MNKYLVGAIILGGAIVAAAIILLWVAFVTGDMEGLKSTFIDDWQKTVLIFAPILTALYFVFVFAQR